MKHYQLLRLNLGLKLKRKIDTGLKDEYDFQIVEDLLSFGESVED